jgi:hypothetical protein
LADPGFRQHRNANAEVRPKFGKKRPVLDSSATVAYDPPSDRFGAGQFGFSALCMQRRLEPDRL